MIYCCTSTMVFMYFLFCYVTALTDQVDSYVLLAANLDDFRTIAKKFVPEKLADQIVDLATNHRAKQEPEYSQESELSQQEPTYEVKTEAYKKSMPRYNLKQNAAALTIDEIVERVKQKLQSEMNQPPKKMVRLTSGNAGNPALNQYDYRGQDNGEVEEPLYEEATYDVVTEKPSPPPPRIQQPRIIPKRIADRNPNYAKQSQYVERERAVGQERQISSDQGRLNKGRFIQQQPIKPAKTIPTLKPNYLKLKPHGHRIVKSDTKIVTNKKTVRRPPIQTTTTQTIATEMELPNDNDGMIFEAVDMLKSNDSYEDYVTPPREEPYASDEEVPTPEPKMVISFKPKPLSKATTEPALDIEEPLEEEIKEAEIYDDEPTEVTTPAELKARTESLSYEERETKVDPNVTTTTEAVVKGKAKPKMKIGTMIPTRERFKLSSPNYYAKLPTVAEKYNFNEPIPEQDREPENLNPIGAPPSNINGKVMLM